MDKVTGMFVGYVRWGIGWKQKHLPVSGATRARSAKEALGACSQAKTIKGLKTVEGHFIITGLNPESVVGIV